jgi:hypothetical protein
MLNIATPFFVCLFVGLSVSLMLSLQRLQNPHGILMKLGAKKDTSKSAYDKGSNAVPRIFKEICPFKDILF